LAIGLTILCRKWIKKFGIKSFNQVYVPLYRIHGHNTSKLSFAREDKGAAEARWEAEGLGEAEGRG
jgi:hypothetical protein